MCVVSMIGDDWNRRWPKKWPDIPDTFPEIPVRIEKYITREEFDALKKEVEELKDLLIAAKKYDENTGQPDCEMEDKIALIKKIAEAVGVNMDDVFKK